MSGPNGMDMDPPLDPNEFPFTPSISPGQNTDQQDQPITVTWAMYDDIMNRLTFSQTYAENLRDKYEALSNRHSVAWQRYPIVNQCFMCEKVIISMIYEI
jgi:hypothetical protein